MTQALRTFQVSVVLLVCPVGVFGRSALHSLLVPVHQRVGGLLGKPGLLLVLVRIRLLQVGVVRPYFGNFTVFVVAVLAGGARGGPHVLLDGVLDLVELLAHVVGGVVRRRGRGAAGLAAPPNPPEEQHDKAADPHDRDHRAQQRHQEIWLERFVQGLYADFCDRRQNSVVPVAFTDDVSDSLRQILDRISSLLQIFHRYGHVDLVGRLGLLADQVERIFHRQVAQNLQVAQLHTDLFDSYTRPKHLLVHRQRDLGAGAVQVVGVGLAGVFGGRATGGTLPLAHARRHEAVVLPHGQARLPRRALPRAAFPSHLARLRATPHLCTRNPAIVTLAPVAVLVPLGSMRHNAILQDASSSGNFLTPEATLPRWANTSKAIDFIHTGGSIGTRRGLAFIDVYSAIRSGKARSAFTPIPVLAVHTGPTVVTRVWIAVICILRARGSFPSFLTDAGVGVPIHHARATVLAKVWQAAAIASDVARGPIPAQRTHAFKRVALVVASAAIVAGRRVALTIP